MSSDIKIGDVKLETDPEPTKEPTPLDTADPTEEAPSEGKAPPSSEGA